MRRIQIICFSLLLAVPTWLNAQQPEEEPVDTTWYVPGDINYNLIIAAYLGRDDDVLRFLNAGAYINTTTMSGNSPLLMAAGQGNLSTVKLLLLNGAEIDQDNIDGIFPLMQATLNNHIEIVEWLIRQGADINKKDNLGRTALLVASAYNNGKITDLLLYAGADIAAGDKQGTTPLMAAVYAGNIGLAEFLIEQGAQVNQADKKGFTPLMIATQMKDTAFVRMLRNKGANWAAMNQDGHSPLTIAVASGDTSLARQFLELDSSGILRSEASVNPMEFARRNNDSHMMNLLARYGYQRKFNLYFSSTYFGASSILNTRDLFSGLEAGITEGYTGITLSAGFQLRPTPVRVHIAGSENYYFQYWERRFLAYSQLSRDFRVVGSPVSAQAGFSASILCGISGGPKWQGSIEKPDRIVVVSPGGGIYYRNSFWKIQLSYRYMDLKTLRLYPHYITLKATVHFGLKTITPPHKTISWY